MLSGYQGNTVIDGLIFMPTIKDKLYFKKFVDNAINARVNAIHVTVADPLADFKQTVNQLAAWLETIEENPKLVLATTTEGIKRAKKEKKLAIILGLQNAEPLEHNLAFLRVFHRLGVRIIQLTYQEQNSVGAGCGELSDSGLSKFGIKVIKEMNNLGMIVDLSHCGYKTTMDAIKFSEDPVVFSHSCPRFLCKHIRCKSDEEIIALAKKGGVIGLTAFSPVSEVERGKRPTLENFLSLIDYVVDLVGEEHVGIGSDFCPMWNEEDVEIVKQKFPELIGTYTYENLWVEGFSNISCFPNLIRGLKVRGYSVESIKKILGGNFLRIFKTVWGK